MSKESDRELLALAAKAAGMMDELDLVDGLLLYKECDGPYRTQWDPLDDDGEALRIAVRLGIRVYVYPGCGDDYTIAATDDSVPVKGWAREEHVTDAVAATRRAIVRAAAAIGEQQG